MLFRRYDDSRASQLPTKCIAWVWEDFRGSEPASMGRGIPLFGIALSSAPSAF
jgi:hypothetical protein